MYIVYIVVVYDIARGEAQAIVNAANAEARSIKEVKNNIITITRIN
jgi:hypothetical protein